MPQPQYLVVVLHVQSHAMMSRVEFDAGPCINPSRCPMQRGAKTSAMVVRAASRTALVGTKDYAIIYDLDEGPRGLSTRTIVESQRSQVAGMA